MKNKGIVIVIGLVLIIVLSILLVNTNNNSKDAAKFKKEYESINGEVREKDGKVIRTINIPSDNPMIYADASDIVKKMDNKESFIVYFGFKDCPWCRSVISTLIDTAKKEKINKIYYVDVLEIRDTMALDEKNNVYVTSEGTKGYYDLLKKLDKVLADYKLKTNDGVEVDTNEKRIFAPNVVSVVDGKAVLLVEGISNKQTDGYMKITKEMKKDTIGQFKKLFDTQK